MADYCTVAEVKAHMPDTTWGSTYDAILASLVTRASRALDRFTMRGDNEFYASGDTTRYFDGTGGNELWIDELADEPTSLSVAESGDVDSSAGTGGIYTAWAAADYLLWPQNAPPRGKPYLKVIVDILNGTKSYFYPYHKSVKVVGKFGYSIAPPPEIVEAAIIQSVRWFKRGQQAFRDVGAIAELGQLSYVQKLDPDVSLMVEHYMRYVP